MEPVETNQSACTPLRTDASKVHLLRCDDTDERASINKSVQDPLLTKWPKEKYNTEMQGRNPAGDRVVHSETHLKSNDARASVKKSVKDPLLAREWLEEKYNTEMQGRNPAEDKEVISETHLKSSDATGEASTTTAWWRRGFKVSTHIRTARSQDDLTTAVQDITTNTNHYDTGD